MLLKWSATRRVPAPSRPPPTHTFMTPPMRSEAKMIRRPSGVHTGDASWPGSNVSRVSVARRRSQTKRSPLLVPATTRDLSRRARDAGWAGNLKGGAAKASSLPIRSTHSGVRPAPSELCRRVPRTQRPIGGGSEFARCHTPVVTSRGTTGTAVPCVSRRLRSNGMARSVPAAV